KSKFLKRFMVSALAVGMLLGMAPTKVHAAEGFYGNYNKLNPGVSNKNFYIKDGTSSYWQTLVNDSFYLWYVTPTKINFNRTYDYNSSIIDCGTEGDTSNDAPWGYALMWVIQSGPDKPANTSIQSWDYGTVTINNAIMQNTTYEFDSRVIMHEVGHVFGLDHVSNPYDLMYGSSQGHMTDRPSANDINKVNTLY
ncbi:MAG: matrixin family metalloprotease, partial [Fusobacteriaceae bacterium]